MNDEDFRLRFEALSRLDQDERVVIKELIDGMLLKHEARRLAGARHRQRRKSASRNALTLSG